MSAIYCHNHVLHVPPGTCALGVYQALDDGKPSAAVIITVSQRPAGLPFGAEVSSKETQLRAVLIFDDPAALDVWAESIQKAKALLEELRKESAGEQA